MSNQAKTHDIVDGPNKALLSMALLYANELASPALEFVFQKTEGLHDGHFRFTKNLDTGKVYEDFFIQAIEAEDGSRESWNITARSEVHGKAEIYFRTDSREGVIEFLEIEE
jgi:hypothetical protein